MLMSFFFFFVLNLNIATSNDLYSYSKQKRTCNSSNVVKVSVFFSLQMYSFTVVHSIIIFFFQQGCSLFLLDTT